MSRCLCLCIRVGLRACLREYIYLYGVGRVGGGDPLNFVYTILSSSDEKLKSANNGFLIGVSPASIRAVNEVEFKAPHYRAFFIVRSCFPHKTIPL